MKFDLTATWISTTYLCVEAPSAEAVKAWADKVDWDNYMFAPVPNPIITIDVSGEPYPLINVDEDGMEV